MKRCLVLLLLIISGLCIVFYKSLDYSHKMTGSVIEVFEQYYNGAVGYDSNLYDNYSERGSVNSELKSDENIAMIPVPLGIYKALRIDINDNFELLEINICTGQMTSTAYISSNTRNKCRVYFPIVTLILILVYYAHGVQQRELGLVINKYLKYLFVGAEPNSEHKVYLDYMRVFATFLVILTHTCAPIVEFANENWKRFILICGESIGLCCNPVYIMLSGALLLSTNVNNVQKVGTFYLKRVSKVAIPLFIYEFFILWNNGQAKFIPPENIVVSIKQIISGQVATAEHLWLIYVVIALYISAPFFAIMVKRLFNTKSNLAIRFLTRYSYSIILIHWFSLSGIVEGRLHIDALRFGCIGGIGVTVMLTLVISIVLAVVIDNTVVIVCTVLFSVY